MKLIFDSTETVTVDLIWKEVCAGEDQHKPLTSMQMTKSQLQAVRRELGITADIKLDTFKIYGVPVEIYHPKGNQSPK